MLFFFIIIFCLKITSLLNKNLNLKVFFFLESNPYSNNEFWRRSFILIHLVLNGLQDRQIWVHLISFLL